MENIVSGLQGDFSCVGETAVLSADDVRTELHVLGAVDAKMQLTQLGRKLAVFPLDPTLAKVIIAAHERHALHGNGARACMCDGQRD